MADALFPLVQLLAAVVPVLQIVPALVPGVHLKSVGVLPVLQELGVDLGVVPAAHEAPRLPLEQWVVPKGP